MLLCAGQEASASFAQKKQNLTTDGTRMNTDLPIQKLLLNFFDPWKSVLSVLSVVRFGVCAGVL
jgi:hypothetical protein